MIVIGLLGGVASGKSFVAKAFQSLGAAVLDADNAGHQTLRSPAIRNAVVERFGPQILHADGEIDRKALGRIVFARTEEGRAALRDLERLTHPEIRRLLSVQAAELLASGAPAAILDAPVMLKAGWDSICDKIVYVECPYTTRLRRAESRGWSEEEFLAREAAQESLDEKRGRADWIIDNSGSPEETQARVQHLLEIALRLLRPRSR